MMAGSILVTTACAFGYANDDRYLDWANRTEEKCAALYGQLPFKTAEQRNAFLEMGYQTYYGHLNRAVFSSRLGRQYPNHLLNIDCIANSFPTPGLDTNSI